MIAEARILRVNSKGAQGSENTITFDVCLKETHSGEADVTEHPVETGANISDHVRAKLPHLTLEVMVSNRPITPPTTQADGVTGQVSGAAITYDVPLHLPISIPGVPTLAALFGANVLTKHDTANVLQFSASFDRVQAVFAALLEVKDAGELVDVATRVYYYTNMVVTSVSAPREAGSGGAVTLTVEFKGIRFVNTETITAAAAPTPAKGVQPPKTTTDAAGDKGLSSALSNALAKVKSLL